MLCLSSQYMCQRSPGQEGLHPIDRKSHKLTIISHIAYVILLSGSHASRFDKVDGERFRVIEGVSWKAYREWADSHLYASDPRAATNDSRQAILIGEPDATLFARSALAWLFWDLARKTRRIWGAPWSWPA